MNQLLIATNNQGKLAEFQALLNDLNAELVTPSQLGLDLDVLEDGATYAENAAQKALAFAAASGLPSLADDSGLEVDALGSEPGLYSARYGSSHSLPLNSQNFGGAGGGRLSDGDRRNYLLGKLQPFPRPWTARFRAVIAIAMPDRRLGLREQASAHQIFARRLNFREQAPGVQSFGRRLNFWERVPALQTFARRLGLREQAPGVQSFGRRLNFWERVPALQTFARRLGLREQAPGVQSFGRRLGFREQAPGIQIFEGVCEGEIIPEERGMGGFGYDPIFLLPELGKTMAELSMDEKNRLSHRARAVMKARETLKQMLT